MPWQILLEGTDRERALERAREIARDLSTAKLDRAGLAGGKSGVALAFAYLAPAGLGGDELVDELLGQAIDALAEEPLDPSLYAGFTGIAWAAEHLAAEPADDGEDANEEIDAALVELLGITPWVQDYDLVSGLVGHSAYALQRIEHGRGSGRRILELAVERLAETAVEVAGAPGVTWWTNPATLMEQVRATSPQGYYNCGLAHGVPGVIAVLAGALAHGVAEPTARPLLERAVAWFLAQRAERPDGTQFPYSVNIPPHEERRAVRCAWCYGDPGIAVSLVWAGQLAGEPRWVETGLDVARRSARRRDRSAGVVDAGICHGSAGLALIYNRLWQASGDELLRDAAAFWARRTVEMHVPGKGIGGYRAFYPVEAADEDQWREEPGLLTGSAGIAATLVACATDVEPRWDGFLLTSARPR